MADTDIQLPEAPAADPAKAQLDALMNFALNPSAQNVPRGTEVQVPDTPIANNEPPAIPDTPTPPVFSFDTLKEKFGFNTPEDAFSEIEQYRAYKTNPPAMEIEFENEDSKRVFELLKSGKTGEVAKILAQQERLNELLTVEVNKDTASDIVKQGMQLKYKDLTSAEIEYKFKKQFALPPKPVQSTGEDADDYQARVSAWQEVVTDKQMELMIEAKLARPELEQSKIKLVFPDIDQPVDEGYLNYRKSVEDNSKLAAEAITAYKAMNLDMIETKIPFVDEKNGVKFEFQYKPDPTAYAQAVEMAMDIDKMYDHFFNPDGTPRRTDFLKFIHNGLNYENMLKEALGQSKNATLKSILPDNSQGGGLVRQLNSPVEQSELDKYMANAGIAKR